MRLSIVVPSFNHGRFIAATLDSILQQTLPPHEVIVVDGASTDDTVEILKAYAARHPQLSWISEKDKGPADAVNKGLARVTGDWIGICSSDDLYKPGVFDLVAATSTVYTDCGFIYGDVQGMTVDGKPLGASSFPEFSWPAYFGIAATLHQGSIFFSAALARAVGGWNPAYYGCDLDYWMRLVFRTRAVKIPRVLSDWRVYPEQRTRPERFAQISRDYWRMIDDALEVRDAPPRVRRLALASRHIMSLMYPPTDNRWVLRRHLLAALAGHPTFWRYQPRTHSIGLLPGYGALRALYRRFVPLEAPTA